MMGTDLACIGSLDESRWFRRGAAVVVDMLDLKEEDMSSHLGIKTIHQACRTGNTGGGSCG